MNLNPTSTTATVLTYIVLPATAFYLSYPLMASFLRSIVAGPRLQHDEAGLDLCYVSTSPTIIAMSTPALEFPKTAYRNPLDQVIKFLDSKHGSKWHIWEFRAEGTGYKDLDVYGRIFHAPFPDHHPPPFALVPAVLASMRNHLKGEGKEDSVAVIHCKAGKGRSGTMSCAYLIGEEGWSADDALANYTRVRMRPGFGEGVSIPSQRRWIRYVERWARNLEKMYLERSIQIEEIHVHGLRDGVRVSIEGFVDEGKEIKTYHTFTKREEIAIDPVSTTQPSSMPAAVIFKPKTPVALPSNDVNIDFERRHAAVYGWSMVTSIAHVWFNAYFEGDENSGLFEIEWDEMDGIKGTLRKGIRMFDRLKVIWSVNRSSEHSVPEPAEGEPIPQPRRAATKLLRERDLGLERRDDNDDVTSPSSSSGSISSRSATSLLQDNEDAERGVAEESYQGEAPPASNVQELVEREEHRVGTVEKKKGEYSGAVQLN